MKNLLTAFAVIFGLISVHAQVTTCTPDPANLPTGYHPAAIVDGQETVPYQHTVTIVVPQDTTVQGFTVPIDSIQVTGISNLPAGLSFYCNTGSCGIPGGQKGCVLVSGRPDPGTAGDYALTVTGTIYANLFGSPLAVPFSQFYDTLTVIAPPSTLSADFIWTSSCLDDSVQFLNYSSGLSNSWTWEVSSLGLTLTEENPKVRFFFSSTYDVTLTVSDGVQTDSITKSVTISPNPNAFAPADDTACQGDQINLLATGSGGDVFRWRPAADLTSVNTPATVFMLPVDTTQAFMPNQLIVRHIDTSNGCYGEDTVMIYGENCPTGISSLFDGETAYTYPNPVSDYVTVVFNSNRQRQVELSLIDLSGRHIFSEGKGVSEGQNNLQLDLNGLPSGWYLLRMTDGRESWQQGLIVR